MKVLISVDFPRQTLKMASRLSTWQYEGNNEDKDKEENNNEDNDNEDNNTKDNKNKDNNSEDNEKEDNNNKDNDNEDTDNEDSNIYCPFGDYHYEHYRRLYDLMKIDSCINPTPT